MNSDRLTYLYQRYLADACTYDELQEFKAILKHNQHNPELNRLMDDTWDTLPDVDSRYDYDRFDHIYNKVIQRPQAVKGSNGLWLKIAASVILIISAALVFYATRPAINRQHAAINKKQPNIILPGSNRAVLTLANGKKVELDEKLSGDVAVQSNAVIREAGHGRLIYTAKLASQAPVANALNTLTVPAGGQYNIVLADGTKVFLNAQSSLTYPARFTGNQRNVTLTGEAYFEVAKNAAMPFKVDVAGKQLVEVLGTHFNITAYTNDDNIKTTLLEGSVKLSLAKQQTVLKPGQMAYQNLSTSALKVYPVDVNEIIAWKNGYFLFRHNDIKSIMKQIARWYNVDIVYSGAVTSHTFGGIYLRNLELSELLKGLEYTGLVHFKTEGRRVTVMP